MDRFYEALGNVLTNRRDNDLEVLKSNVDYIERKNEQILFRNALAAVSPEAEKAFEDYLEVTEWVTAMEYNAVLLCGINLKDELQKWLNAETQEHQDFAAIFL